MPHTPRTMYLVLAVWCIVGSSLRIWWFARHGLQVDALPIITIVLALAALVLAFRPLRPERRDGEP